MNMRVTMSSRPPVYRTLVAPRNKPSEQERDAARDALIYSCMSHSNGVGVLISAVASNSIKLDYNEVQL